MMLETVPSAMDPQTADRVHRTVCHWREQAETAFLELGKALAVVYRRQLWQQYGAATFEEYLAWPEVRLSRGQALKLVKVAETYSLRYQGDMITVAPCTETEVARMGVERAALVADFVTPDDPERAREWIDRAQTLAVTDLERAVKDEKRGTPLDDAGEWLRDEGYALAAIARRLTDGPAVPDAVAICDRLVDRAMAVRERLKGQG